MVDFSSSKITLDGKHKQLIDLNKDQTLFESEFTITPHTLDLDKTYEIAVVSQSVLDADEIIYKEVNGIYKGNVKHDDKSSEYENFFLVIKGSVPIKELIIEVVMKPIKIEQPSPSIETHERDVEETEKNNVECYRERESFFSRNKIKIIICFFVLVAGCYLMYYFWKKNQTATKASTESITENIQLPLVSQKFEKFVKDTQLPVTTEKLFNPFNRRKGRSPPSIASSGFSKSPGSESSKSFVFEE
jgi:hypothetical protein